MKNKCSVILILLTLIMLPLYGQQISYSSPTGLKIGFGLGGSWLSSDVPNSRGTGLDLWLGTPIYQADDAFLALDWRFHFLAGTNNAYDHSVQPDGSYFNVQLNHFNYDLELLLTLHRLRERTGIILGGFLGAGLTHGITRADLRDASNNAYDYSSISSGLTPGQILDELVQLTDGDFETQVQSKASFMPTAGLYLGYQFTPRFSLGAEYKTNISLSEDNSFFGLDMDNRISSGSGIDRINYAGLTFKWALGRRSLRSTPGSVDQEVVAGPAVYPPQVDIAVPHDNPHFTTEREVKVTSRAFNISRREDIRVTLNGQNQNFQFYNSISSIELMVLLRPGSNSLVVSASNAAGSDSDAIDIILGEAQAPPPAQVVPGTVAGAVAVSPQGSPPEITFFQPAHSREIYNAPVAEVIAGISRVESPRDIDVWVNGSSSDFSFDMNTQTLNVLVPLKDGTTRVEITARNAYGTDRKSRSMIRESINQMQTSMIVPDMPAQRYPVSDNPNPNINTNPPAGDPNPVEVHNPRTTVIVDPKESIGRDPKTTTPGDPGNPGNPGNPCKVPVVQLDVTAVSSTTSTYVVTARIREVEQRENVALIVNGRVINNFSFNPATDILSANLNLGAGTNQIIVKGSNACGSSQDSETINLAAPCKKPSVEMRVFANTGGNYTHRITGSAREVDSKNKITLMVNGKASNFNFSPASGQLSANFNLKSGSNSIVLIARNQCGEDRASETVNVQGTTPVVVPPPGTGTDPGDTNDGNAGWVRINPGNADWEFCLKTSNGQFNRSHLKNASFSYSGTASSLFFKPIAGGGTALVNGQPYSLKSGQYYLFTGSLKVKVTKNRQGAMGQWSVYIESGKAPATGNGNNRPASPCESGTKRPSR